MIFLNSHKKTMLDGCMKTTTIQPVRKRRIKEAIPHVPDHSSMPWEALLKEQDKSAYTLIHIETCMFNQCINELKQGKKLSGKKREFMLAVADKRTLFKPKGKVVMLLEPFKM